MKVILSEEQFEQFNKIQSMYIEVVKQQKELTIMRGLIRADIHKMWVKFRDQYPLEMDKGYGINMQTREIFETEINFDSEIDNEVIT